MGLVEVELAQHLVRVKARKVEFSGTEQQKRDFHQLVLKERATRNLGVSELH
jgi:hypothetical protein